MGLRLVVVVAMAFASSMAAGAGQRTHVEMGKRAIERYCPAVDDMLPGFTKFFSEQRVRGAFYCGCMFPDWGFAGINDAAAEDSHWKKFQDAYFALLVEKCPPPWTSEEDRKRVAFFLGLVSHGMTDLPWHFSKEGHSSLLEAAWNADRAGHSQCEMTYDIFLYRDGAGAQTLIGDVWWPLADIREAYRRTGRVLLDGQLERSMQRTHAMIHGGPLGARIAADSLQRQYPWVHGKVNEYYFGGVEHGAALTASWLKFFYARLNGVRFYQAVPTACAEDKDDRVYRGVTDASIRSKDPDFNTGGEPMLDLSGDGSGDERAALVRFDVSDLPEDAEVAKAAVWLYFHSWAGSTPIGPKAIAVYGVDAPWTQGTGRTDLVDGWRGTPEGGGATWNSFDWPKSARKPVDRVKVDPSDPPGRWLQWDVTKLARAWTKRPGDNHGMVFRSADPAREGPGVVRVYSSDAFQTKPDGFGGGDRIAYRPVLVVTPKGKGSR